MNRMKAQRCTRASLGIFLLTASALLISGLVACGSGATEIDDDAEAKKLQTEVKDWKSWKQHAKFTGIKKSKDGTHGKYVAIYMNATAAGVEGKFDGKFPNGSIFVKRGYDDAEGKKPKAWVTIMKKIDGSDPDNGDWFTMSLSDDGKLSAYKKSDKGGCMGCHSKYKDDDYIGAPKEEGYKF